VTGWAQVNGGTLITNDEKGALDEWYVRRASPWLDLRILALTIRFAFTGERRSERAVNKALLEQSNGHGHKTPPSTPTTMQGEPGPALRGRFASRAKVVQIPAHIELHTRSKNV
jgi:Bacterial sugar transferase